MNKPKFKVGDKVVYNGEPYKVIDICHYETDDSKYEYTLESFDFDRLYHHIDEDRLSSYTFIKNGDRTIEISYNPFGTLIEDYVLGDKVRIISPGLEGMVGTIEKFYRIQNRYSCYTINYSNYFSIAIEGAPDNFIVNRNDVEPTRETIKRWENLNMKNVT